LTLAELLKGLGLGLDRFDEVSHKLRRPPGDGLRVRGTAAGTLSNSASVAVSMYVLSVWECTPPAPVLGRERAPLPERQRMQQVIVRTYKAKSRPIAVKAFSDEAKTLASQGYIVVLQSWEPGKTGRIFKPGGSLTVTYRLDSAPNVPKPQS
jgi:hypothetical protein